jgi:hypothetical protein
MVNSAKAKGGYGTFYWFLVGDSLDVFMSAVQVEEL